MSEISTRKPGLSIFAKKGEPSRRNPLIYSRWPLFIARVLTLAGFVLTIFAGLFGSVIGSSNFAIIFVWIAWWTALKLLFIPLGGRSWCAVCPIPMPGEWLAQGSIFPGGKKNSLGRKWPRRLSLGILGTVNLRGTWLQSGGFLMIGLFSAVTLTSPRLTGWVLLGIIVLALVTSLIFEKRAFCNHLCPIGGFTGLYAQAAPVEIRVKDRAVCAAHQEKTCYQNCPWGVYVTALKDNGPCGMCMECIRVCPHDNVSINLRQFGKDLIDTPILSPLSPRHSLRLDEAFLALVMLGCGLAFSAVFLGPWGSLRRAAYHVGSLEWLVYGAGFFFFAGLLIPGLYALLIKLSGPVVSIRKSMARFARPLLPLGLAAWIAFTISFAFAKVSYVLPVLSDPFGRGWDLFGLANVVWSPDVSVISPILQATILLGGLVWMGQISRREADTPRRAMALQGFGLLITASMLMLLVG